MYYKKDKSKKMKTVGRPTVLKFGKNYIKKYLKKVKKSVDFFYGAW